MLAQMEDNPAPGAAGSGKGIHGLMPELQPLRLDHGPALLAFERENRAYFAASIPDRGDDYFATFAERHRELLAWQA